MRILVATLTIALLAPTAPAQAKARKQQQDAPKTEDQASKKAADKAYQDTLKRIPASTEKPDPWKSMR